jgi:hypothetical protein
MPAPNLQDLSLLRSHLDKIIADSGLNDRVTAFYYLLLQLLLDLQDDEIRDALTDNSYLVANTNMGGHDRGIDALYIDTSEATARIHLFNCKLTEKFEKLDNFFPANEIDKIVGFLQSLFGRNDNLVTEVNPVLASKVEEIWDLFQSQNPEFTLHICSNLYNGLEPNERARLERAASNFNVKVEYFLMPDIVKTITRKGKEPVDAKIRAIDFNYFEKSDGDIRALVVNIPVLDLLRIVIDDPELRLQADLPSYDVLKGVDVQEDAFDQNVRVYLKQRSKINRNIKKTALGDESFRFFYFNNGITITCDEYTFVKNQRNPVIELKNLQVVNGSQTIHALLEAFNEDDSRLAKMDVLCRIYETKNAALSTKIAEYTNSQNPVSSRDIRSIDFIQEKLDSEFQALGYYYERKKSLYADKPKNKRIDAEKAGQVLMSFFNELPGEAKNDKRLIFREEYYDKVFSDDITAEKVLLGVKLFDKIEEVKAKVKAEVASDKELYAANEYLFHSSYYILYVIKKIAVAKAIPQQFSEYDRIVALYDCAIKIIKRLIEIEKSINKKGKYLDAEFFKYSQPKVHLEHLLANGEFETLIEDCG